MPKKISKALSKTFELPKEVVLDLPLISIIGNEEVNIENYKGIIEYSEECIRLKTSAGVIKLSGRNLFLKQLTSETIVVNGVTEKIEFLK